MQRITRRIASEARSSLIAVVTLRLSCLDSATEPAARKLGKRHDL
jgi:hypothetical protein